MTSLASELRAEGGLLAACVVDSDEATLPRSSFVVEAIHEGYLQHYAAGLVVRSEDDDLALLAGDRLYALGMARLAELGDLETVIELADLISLCAQSHAEGEPARAAAAWEAATIARRGAD